MCVATFRVQKIPSPYCQGSLPEGELYIHQSPIASSHDYTCTTQELVTLSDVSRLWEQARDADVGALGRFGQIVWELTSRGGIG